MFNCSEFYKLGISSYEVLRLLVSLENDKLWIPFLHGEMSRARQRLFPLAVGGEFLFAIDLPTPYYITQPNLFIYAISPAFEDHCPGTDELYT